MRLIVGNFKMNLNSGEIDNYIDFFKGLIQVMCQLVNLKVLGLLILL